MSIKRRGSGVSDFERHALGAEAGYEHFTDSGGGGQDAGAIGQFIEG